MVTIFFDMPITVDAAPKAESKISSEYKKVSENESFELYLYEPTLSIILKNKETGAILRSTLAEEEDDGLNNNTWNAFLRSGIVLSAIKGTTDTYQVDLVSCPNDIDYTYNDKGFSAKIYFKEYKFGLTVNVILEGKDIVVEVPDESIYEEGSAYIGTISLYPLMGYTYLDSQEGYMFIPDGSGALIYLNDKEGKYTTGFSQMIYGSDAGFTESSTEVFLWYEYKMLNNPNKVLMPVFGMVHSEDELGYLAVVEEGDERASIEAHPNGVMINYNRCYAKFLLRRTYVQPLNNSNSGTVINVESDRTHSNLKVRYMLVTGKEADYSGMAVAYRNYLLDNGMLSAKDTSYKTRVDFLGTDREDFLISTKAVTMTTTSQIREIYDELQAAGVDSLLSVYKGWQKGGYYNLPISKYKADSHIGGTTKLTSLIKEAAEENYDIYLYNNTLLANSEETNTTFNTVKRVNKRRLEIDFWGQVYRIFNYLLPSKSDSNLTKFTNTYTQKGVDNLSITGMTNYLFSYSYNGKFYTRFDTAASYKNTINTVAEKTNLILEKPFAFYWNNTNAFLDMPLGSSDYMYEDEEVPFLPIVLKGIMPMYSEYVNFEANKKEFWLEMVEAGAYPSFYLTYEDSSKLIYTDSSGLYSTKYETYKDLVIEYDTVFRELAKATDGAFITKHEKLEGGVNKVTYDNGATIYVNYSNNTVTVDGYEIEGLSYKVGESK